MFLAIYNIYVDAIIFIRKNIYVLLPYIFYTVLNLLLNLLLPERLTIRSFAMLLIVCFLEMIIVVIVYKKEGIIVVEESIWQTFNRFSGSVLLLIVYGAFIVFLSLFLSTFIFRNMNALGNLAVFLVTCVALIACPISLRHLIYYNNIMVIDSIRAGLKELFKNFSFYLSVFLLSIGILIFPSLLSPSTWFTVPILPLAEFVGWGYKSGINWLRVLLDPFLSTLASVALTYAFIYKNKKSKHVS